MQGIDFFCGAGGLTRGLIDAGIEVRAGFDLDERCKQAYEYNNPPSGFFQADIAEMNIRTLRHASGLRRFDDVLFAGCAPCQPFSQLRKSRKRGSDALLLNAFGKLVEEANPGYVLIENVPGMASVGGFSAFRRFLRMLKNNSYRFVYGVLDAKHFGVPQNRRRLLLLASKRAGVILPAPSHGNGYRPFRTVRSAISRFPEIKAGEVHPEVPNHACSAITALNIERLQATPHDGGDRRSWPDHLLLECHKKKHTGHTDSYGRMRWDAPAPTLTGRCHSISNGRYGHPEQDRAISLREAASLQSFPDNYVFFGSNKSIAQQIGNAVPPRFAKSVGKHIMLNYPSSPVLYRRSP